MDKERQTLLAMAEAITHDDPDIGVVEIMKRIQSNFDGLEKRLALLEELDRNRKLAEMKETS